MSTRAAITIAVAALAGSGAYLILAGSPGRGRLPGARASGLRPVPVERDLVTAEERTAGAGGTRDGALVEGRLVVATAAGLRVAGEDRAHVFGESEVTAMTAYRGRAVFGTADGTVVVATERLGEALRFPGFGQITELCADGDRLYVGTVDGLVVWDGTAKTPALPLGTVTALAPGPRGVAVGTAEGDLFLARDGAVEPLPARVEDRISALAWDGEALYVGTPFALLRVAGSEVHTVRRDLSVTAILIHGGDLYLGTFDDGVVALDPSGRERRLVGREHVRHLRVIGERPVAFGDGGAWDLSGPAASRLV